MQNSRKSSTRRGFSLVELLVVLGVIMILISLLMPAIAGSRARARLIACESEMRQLGIMVAGYCGDNAGRFPFPLSFREDGNYEMRGGSVWTPAHAVAIGTYWPVSMFEEFGGTMYADVLLCPNDRSSLGERTNEAAASGVPVSEVQLPAMRVLTVTAFVDANALRDELLVWDDRFLHVNALHDAAFPSQKVLLHEVEPLHEPGYFHIVDEAGRYEAELPIPTRYHASIAAMDGSSHWVNTEDAIPSIDASGVAREIMRQNGMSEPEIELTLGTVIVPNYFTYTRDGVRGRDW